MFPILRKMKLSDKDISKVVRSLNFPNGFVSLRYQLYHGTKYYSVITNSIVINGVNTEYVRSYLYKNYMDISLILFS